MTKGEQAKLYDEWKRKMNSLPMKARLSKLGEEASELASAIQKYIGVTACGWPDHGDANGAFLQIVSEAADVFGMMEATRLTPDTAVEGIKERLQSAIETKRARFVGRVNDGAEAKPKVEDDPQKDMTQRHGICSEQICANCNVADTCPINMMRKRREARGAQDQDTSAKIKKRMNQKYGSGLRLIVVSAPTATLGSTSCRGGIDPGIKNQWHDGISGDFE